MASADDFINTVIHDVGVSLTKVPVTKEIDQLTGDESLVEGTSTTVTAYFVRKFQKWQFDKEGRIEGGDAFMMSSTTATANVNDIIVRDGEQFRVQDKIQRKYGSINMCVSYNLFLVQA